MTSDGPVWKPLASAKDSLVPVEDWITSDERCSLNDYAAAIAALEERREALQHAVDQLEEQRDRERDRMRAEVRAECDARLGMALRALDATLLRSRERLLRSAAHAVHEGLCMLLRDAVSQRPDLLLPQVETLLDRHASGGVVRLRVPPAQVEALRARLAHRPAFEVVADSRLSPADAIVEVSDGQYDCRLARLLPEVTDELERTLLVDAGDEDPT